MFPFLVRRDRGAFRARVDPRTIRYAKTGGEWPGYVGWWPFLACPGRWDLYDDEYPPFREDLMRELFVEGRHYRDTDVYRWLLSLAREGGQHKEWPCGSREEIEEYFQKVLKLGRSIREKGVVAPDAGGGTPTDGITVRVARDGSLLKCGQGTHRLAIARVLQIRRVPVVIDLVHTRWVRRAGGGAVGTPAIDRALQKLGELAEAP